MDCIICGGWFSSLFNNGACPTCSRAIKQLGLNMTPNRILEIVQAEKDGKLTMDRRPVTKFEDSESMNDKN